MATDVAVERASGPTEQRLPDGWVVTRCSGPGGQEHFAVYASGRREVSGLPSLASAYRWATLCARYRQRPPASDPLPTSPSIPAGAGGLR